MITPYSWQLPLVDAVLASLRDRRVVISGFPTGAGKTVIALAAAKALERPHLVICPKAAVTQWRRVAEQMGATNLLLDVINPEKLTTARGCAYYDKVRRWRLPPQTYVVWDEPHRGASGIKSAQTEALAYLKAYCAGLHAMSATIADTPLKLRGLGFWLGLHQYYDNSFYSWCETHGCRMETVNRDGRKGFRFETNPKKAAAHMRAIRAEIGPAFLCMRAEEIPGFPTETIGVIRIDLNADDRREIEKAYEEMSDRLKTRARSWLAETARERERIEFAMAKGLAGLAAGHVEAGSSPVVFFNYTEPRLRFEAELRQLGVTDFLSIYGGQNSTVRQAEIDAFQDNKLRAASIMMKAGGAALSLHDVKHERPRVSLITPAYEADLIKQALGRIRRCGGTPAVQHFIIAAGTVMEAVAARLETKTGNIDALNDGDMNPVNG